MPELGSISPPIDPAVEWMELAFDPLLGFGTITWPDLLAVVSSQVHACMDFYPAHLKELSARV